ncbi:MAG TPA: dipeptide ABC transporter permease DppC, partial [Inquilinus sp.]|nr:dipeptide ABC transporter permease DppC [Inquilinus sp.]
MTAPSLQETRPAAVATKPPGPFIEFWRSFSANKGALGGLIVIVVIALVAIFAGVIAPHSPIDQDRTAFLVPPFWQAGGNWAYPLGTDDIGRDILSRLIYGARLSMMIGLIVVTLSLAVGLVLGLVAGFFGGIVDMAIMRLLDIMLAL